MANKLTPSGMSARLLILILFSFLSLQPLSTDLYLPSLPTITKALAVSNTQIQLTMSLFVAAYALSQLVAGPFTDRFGRWPGTLIGCSVYLVGSLLCATASSLDPLVLGRIAQGAGVGIVVVCGRAFFRDSFEPDEGAKVLAVVYTWIGIVPFTAPFIGGLLLQYVGWQANFWLLSGVAAIELMLAVFVLKETNRFKNPAALNPKPIVKNYWMVLQNAEFRGFTIALAMSFSGLFCFLSGSSFVLIDLLKLTPLQYSFCFSVVCLGYMCGTQIASRLLPRKGIVKTAHIASWFSAAGGMTMLLLVILLPLHPALLLVPMFFFLIGHGMLQPSCQSGAIGPFPQNAGAASAMLGFGMNVTAAIAGLLLANAFNGTALPMAVGVALAGVGAIRATYFGIKDR